MIFTDERGLELTANSAEAVAHLDRTVETHLGLRLDPGDHLEAALEADDGILLGHVTHGYFQLMFVDRSRVSAAERSLAKAEAIAVNNGATDRERSHIAALSAWCRGDAPKASALWENILIDHPRDIMAMRLAHFWHFFFGDGAALRDSVARTMHGWDPDTPGYGFVQGMYSFGLEEAGDYDAAEREGRAAVERNPADSWAAHAVAHVMEMQGRAREGIDWIAEMGDNWDGVGNFAYHVWWHQALFCFDLGEFDAALDIYDREVRAESTEHYLDISNAVAMLWRLEQEDVDVGDRWAELAARSAERIDDHMLVFADAHYMMAFAAAKDDVRASALRESTQIYARDSDEFEADITRTVGLSLMDALSAHRRGDHGRAVDLMMELRPKLSAIGGSHAQRDVFERTLIVAAMDAGRHALARALLSERLQRRPTSGIDWRRYAGVLDALGDRAAASHAASEAARLLVSY